MRILIDGRLYSESGIGRYIKNLILHLQRLDIKNEYFILHLRPDYDRLVYHNNFHKVLADFRWYGIAEQFKLPGIIKKIKLDLVHFPHFNVPVFFHGKFVVTIHDLIHQHFSMQRASTHGALIYRVKQAGYRKVFLNAIKNSEKILVPSNFVKDQLINEWQVDNRKIVITHESVDDKILTAVTKMSTEKGKKVLRKFDIKSPYLFYVGNAHPHKNVEGLIRVFGQLKEKYKALQLVLAGGDHYFWQRVRNEFNQEGIVYTGFVSDEELMALYKNAICFVMPSFEEGFGIPLLEAMACGCPVVSSNAGALPEVGGDATLYFDPKDLGDMEDKIDKVFKSDKLKTELIRKGHKRVRLFSWEKLAGQTLEVYRGCV